MELTEKAAIEVLTTYAPQVGEGNNWNLLIEAIKKLQKRDMPNYYMEILPYINAINCGLLLLDYEKTFWAVVEAINFINELKNGD